MTLRTLTLFNLIILGLGCSPSVEQPILVRSCGFKVQLEDVAPSSTVNLAMVRDGQSVERLPLTRIEGGQFSVDAAVDEGALMYWLEIDGRKTLDPKNPLTKLFNGTDVSWTFVDNCKNGRFVYVRREGSSRFPTFILMLERGRSQAPLAAESVMVRAEEQSVPFTVVEDHLYVDASTLPVGKHYLTVTARDQKGAAIEPFKHPFWIETTQFRWEDATIYQIMVDRFSAETDLEFDPDNYHPGERQGGLIKGITRHLVDGYFEAMGVNVLWLSPLYKNPEGLWTGVEGGPARYSSYHGYWPIEPRKIETRLGSEADFENLVDEAHARGIRVIVDVVPNHIHQEHVYRTEHPSWSSSDGCVCGSPECPWWRDIATCWFTPYLPDVNWNAPGALEQTVEDMVWWLRRFNVDGLRIDAVMMIPRFVTRHLTREVAKSFEGLRTRHYLVGETFTGPDGYHEIRQPLGAHGIDGQFDFPLMWTLRQVFAWRASPMWTLADQWSISQSAWAGSASVMAHMVGNHDVTRFISEATQSGAGSYSAWSNPAPAVLNEVSHGSLRLALAFILTMPGVATVYYGDEIGLAGGHDPDNRRPMVFEPDWAPAQAETARFVRRLGSLRRCLAPFERTAVQFIKAGAERIAYLRRTETQTPMLVILSRSPKEDSMELDLGSGETDALTRMVDVVSGQTYDVRDGVVKDISTRPNQALVLVDAEHPCATYGGGL